MCDVRRNRETWATTVRRIELEAFYKLIAQFSDAQVDLVDSVETGLDH